MNIDTAKLLAIIPELESWTGGERRDLDAHTVADNAYELAYEDAAKIAEGTKAYDDGLQKSAGCSTTGQRIAAAIRAKANGGK